MADIRFISYIFSFYLYIVIILLVTPAGVEPAIFWMRTRRPGPLDEGATPVILT